MSYVKFLDLIIADIESSGCCTPLRLVKAGKFPLGYIAAFQKLRASFRTEGGIFEFPEDLLKCFIRTGRLAGSSKERTILEFPKVYFYRKPCFFV
jgi:hypothetical protein